MATRASPEPDESDLSDYELDSSVDPSSVDDRDWVWCSGTDCEASLAVHHGKWLIFEPMVSLDETWHTIRGAVESGEFGKGYIDARCSTASKSHSGASLDSDGVIQVLTTKKGKKAVGMKVIKRVQRDIQYQRKETESPGQSDQYQEQWLYWNDGKPSFKRCIQPVNINPTSVTNKRWIHCKPPSAPVGVDHGKWLILEPMASLDETWHWIRRAVEGEELGKGCIRAWCSTALKRDHAAADSDGVLQVSTTKEGMDEVGMKLINKVKRDIQYRYNKAESQASQYCRRGPMIMWLSWNDGQPSFGQHRTRSSDVNPTSVTDDHWMHCQPPSTPADAAYGTTEVHGKWRIFEPMVSLDETWHTIRRAVESGEFGKGCIDVRCSTALKPERMAPDSDGVIEISTTKEGMEKVGLKLINKVERDIQYQYNELVGHPQANRYRRKGPTRMWLSWNDGEPSFGHHRTRPAEVNPTSITDDRWVHCQPPSAAAYGARDSSKIHGKWQIFEPMASLDRTWHTIRRAVESGEFGKGCVDVRCSTALKPDRMATNSDRVIEISTTREGMDKIGVKLINKVERDIQYQYEEVKNPSGANRYRWRGPTKISLYWNDRKPSYSDSANPTSITDKHWVRCNPPSAPVAAYHGKWLVFVPMVSLDKTWHRIRRAVESAEFGSQCIGAQCSTALRPDHMHSDSDGVIQVSTTKEGMEEVGMKLIEKIKRNILYQPKEFEVTHRADRYDQSRPVKLWLYWNGGKPSFK